MNDQDLARWVQTKFGFIPNDLTEYRKAINLTEYEVLEFFENSILDFVVAEYLVVSQFRVIRDPGWFTQVKRPFIK
ncbi:hypothetical protein [Nostoc sp. FACHB-280]|uniref:hypothetical protein n=1 Tax=Nostoc sp. FACHB-280 TaxID=2692839 RepID=UPI00168AF343|nr:hypothetical protein [Nostoc sp. FACHB-280]MBD2498908.1 hypothetical protein [Nostoc sp. FACHB-280]